MWETFLCQFNGMSLFLNRDWTSFDVLHCFTDASSLGFGLVYRRKWAYGSWPPTWHGFNICLLEAFPILLVLHLFADDFRNQKVLLHTDNIALVHILNSYTTRDPLILSILRDIVLLTLRFNILIKSVHVAGCKNDQADYLSRLQVAKFKSIHRSAEDHPVPIPVHLRPASYSFT